MSRHIILLRHAQADGLSLAAGDRQRPLTEQGMLQSQRVGDWLANQELVPDGILCSPALRTRQTAELVCRETGFDTAKIRIVDEIYEAPAGQLVTALEEHLNAGSRWLLVGHNPGIENCAAVLTGQPHAGYFRPASLALIRYESWPSSLADGNGRLSGPVLNF